MDPRPVKKAVDVAASIIAAAAAYRALNPREREQLDREFRAVEERHVQGIENFGGISDSQIMRDYTVLVSEAEGMIRNIESLRTSGASEAEINSLAEQLRSMRGQMDDNAGLRAGGPGSSSTSIFREVKQPGTIGRVLSRLPFGNAAAAVAGIRTVPVEETTAETRTVSVAEESSDVTAARAGVATVEDELALRNRGASVPAAKATSIEATKDLLVGAQELADSGNIHEAVLEVSHAAAVKPSSSAVPVRNIADGVDPERVVETTIAAGFADTGDMVEIVRARLSELKASEGAVPVSEQLRETEEAIHTVAGEDEKARQLAGNALAGDASAQEKLSEVPTEEVSSGVKTQIETAMDENRLVRIRENLAKANTVGEKSNPLTLLGSKDAVGEARELSVEHNVSVPAILDDPASLDELQGRIFMRYAVSDGRTPEKDAGVLEASAERTQDEGMKARLLQEVKSLGGGGPKKVSPNLLELLERVFSEKDEQELRKAA